MIPKTVIELLISREFISIATCNSDARPYVAPKFFLKAEDSFIYLVDYVMGTTFKNLKANPLVSISLMDMDDLVGYQINGQVEIIEKGQEYNSLLEEFKAKGISLSSKRIIEGIDRGKTHSSFEIGFSEKMAIFKVIVEEIVTIGPQGQVNKVKV